MADSSPIAGGRAVVLLDEIDKADPDLPNDLLVPLGALEFEVTDVEERVVVRADQPPLVMVTTNEERDLPRAFVRRCVVLALPEPDDDRMLTVARSHFGPKPGSKRLKEVLAKFRAAQQARAPEDYEPGLAEFLDAVAAVIALGTKPGGDDLWRRVEEVTIRKSSGQ